MAAVDEGELRATGGIRLMTDGGMALLGEADTIVVPGWRGIDSPVPPRLCEALVAAHARGVSVIVDNTWATPLFCKPLALGADISVNSAVLLLVGMLDRGMGCTFRSIVSR